ncbi:protein HEAT INTOLERANT 4 [Andrographis paniculata]|uniref:protein HEAT INTOLERANT 4 n=1 Tax=Andrographis paniculata TaxID=175694 RepID=UPI0021E872D4|nr:protein HEAT INTOLERANT 4 [Andrographis paniculata]XP_051130028.1 protein HEAT INTOLERANT 4 [Andrographis paniculata]XP_051130029.1 protein HEAT INTOLERANT 4 [Andrographis paniculata]
MRKGTKRRAANKAESKSKPADNHKSEEENHEDQQGANADPQPSKNEAQRGRPKKAKVSKEEEEPEYFEDQRDLEDLWKEVFPVGTEWDQLDTVYQYKWNFSVLEDAFEEGGDLYNKKVYLFGCTEPQLVPFRDEAKVTMIPVVVAVVSPFPPSDKIGIKSVQRETEEIVPMKQMKMDWVPYIPLGKRGSMVERLKNYQIFILRCNQRRAGLKHLKIDRVKKFEYCLPYYYNPFQEDEIEQSTIVDLLFPIDPKPVFGEFDWELDELEEFTDKLIEGEELPADQKEPFKNFVKEKVREAKKANREAREARKKALAEMSEEAKAAYENMKFFKFYPAPSPDTPDVSRVKSAFINRYYGKAHKVI